MISGGNRYRYTALLVYRYMAESQGYLKLIFGPMFSGKTSKLITLYQHNKVAGIPTCVINYEEDNRYHPTLLSSHDKRMIPCLKVGMIQRVIDEHPEVMKEKKVFIINEGQFFPDLYKCVRFLVRKGKSVYVGGLDGDYQMKKFGQILDLVPIADEVEKLHAICMQCKKPAPFTRRLSCETVQKVIGSSNYIPVCRNCHNLE